MDRILDGTVPAEEGDAMNVQSLKANWKIGMGKLRQRFAKLIADEAEYQHGKQTELIGRILKGNARVRTALPRSRRFRTVTRAADEAFHI